MGMADRGGLRQGGGSADRMPPDAHPGHYSPLRIKLIANATVPPKASGTSAHGSRLRFRFLAEMLDDVLADDQNEQRADDQQPGKLCSLLHHGVQPLAAEGLHRNQQHVPAV
jgi:hypothetical protein